MLTRESDKRPDTNECESCNEEAIYACLGCQNETCSDCQSRGLCLECQGFVFRGNFDIDDIRVHGGEPELINQPKETKHER